LGEEMFKTITEKKEGGEETIYNEDDEMYDKDPFKEIRKTMRKIERDTQKALKKLR
jgi:hypothetical protein